MIIKTFKIVKVSPTGFGLHKPSSGSYSLCLAKITFLLPVYMSWPHICGHDTENICKDMYTGTRNVILAKHSL